MANDLQSPPQPSVTALVSGIVTDMRDLIKQQTALVRSEIQSDFRKTKDAASFLALGSGVALLGVILLCLTAVYALWTYTTLPLWGSFGIVGGALTALGAGMFFAGKRKLDAFNPLPDQSLEGLKENLQWKTNPR